MQSLPRIPREMSNLLNTFYTLTAEVTVPQGTLR